MNRILALQKLEARGSGGAELEFCETTGGGSTLSVGCGGTTPINPYPSTSPGTATD